MQLVKDRPWKRKMLPVWQLRSLPGAPRGLQAPAPLRERRRRKRKREKTVIQVFYGVLFLISVGYLILLLTKFQKHLSIYYTLLSVSIVIINLGYLQISGANSLEAALAGNQVVYLAAPFILLFMIAVLADLCKVRIPFAVKVV